MYNALVNVRNNLTKSDCESICYILYIWKLMALFLVEPMPIFTNKLISKFSSTPSLLKVDSH